MPPLLNSLGQATVNSIILFGVYRYLSLREKKDYLRIWSWGLFFQSIRFLFEIWLVLNNSFIISFLTHILNLLNGYFMVYGTYIFIDKKTPKVFGYLSVFNLLWLPMAYFANLSFSLKMLPVRLFVGIIYITIGIVFIKTINISGIAKAYNRGHIYIMGYS